MSARVASSCRLDAARAALQRIFGYGDFRPGQAEVIDAVLSGAPVLAVMPTGSGKSMCYQLPAHVQGGLTVVVSPLIALMRDQVQQMRMSGIAAATLNSMSSAAETESAWNELHSGELRLLFLSPERLAVRELTDALNRAGVRRLAIDEAHCVSEWGHDFRPEYRGLGRIAEALGHVQVVAFTATADKRTRAEIAERLFAREPQIFVHSFDRPNIALAFAPKDQPRRQIAQFLERHPGESGIIYCSSRDRTERLAEWLRGKGRDAVAYHAGMESALRNRHQDRFLQEDGIVVCATVAFGMGINKPDVRFVVHADIPSSVEAYYQEIGRAGRDDLPADTLTLYGLDDMALRRRQIDAKDISPERRAIEHRRFSAMALICETPTCRRQALLAYFDEPSGPCGHCDNCAGATTLYDGTTDAQKALSAVARTGQRFGAGYLADLLSGEATEAIRRNRHDALKTFGIGRERTKKEWSAIVRQLFAMQALASASDDHGGFRLTEKGEAILFGRETAMLRHDVVTKREARRREAARGLPAANGPVTPVLDALKKLRREMARASGMAAFMIFPDRTLIEMAERRPRSFDEMRRIYGVGERKLTQYGAAFLRAIEAAAG
jgi:ATP-dependent DNA helicase RecQ